MNKFFWYLILFLALLSFMIGFNTGELLFNLNAIILGFLVYRYGNKHILEDYYSRRNLQLEESEKLQRAIRKGQEKKRGKD